MKTTLMTTFLIIFASTIFGQKIFYHEYIPTASSWDIVKWNIENQEKFEWVIQESVDEYNRVIELKFLRDGKIVDSPLCYLASKVKFEYSENIITEILFHGNDTLIAQDCEMYYKSIYHLNVKKQIIRVETFWKFDTSYSKESIEELQEYLPEYTNSVLTDSSQMEVEYYYHSFAKMNGKYPVSEAYELQDDYYYGDEPEKTSIIEGLRK